MINKTTIKVPKKYEHMITEIYKDSDGYWCYCKDGYEFSEMNSQTAHEDTQKDLLRVIRSLVEVKEEEKETVEPVEESPEPTRNVWILEKWMSREYINQQLSDFSKGLGVAKEQGNENLVKAMQETVDLYTRKIHKYPDGYWLAWGGKAIYNQFTREAVDTIKAHRKMDGEDCKFRVVTAKIPQSAKSWIGYKDPVEVKAVLQDLYKLI